MNVNRIPGIVVIAALLTCMGYSSTATGQVANENAAVNARLVVTVKGKGSQAPPVLKKTDVTVLLKNHPTEIREFEPLQGQNAGLQLVFLFDESARASLALQIPSLRKFIEALPASAEVAVAYMSNGRAVMAQTLTQDHALAAKSLRLTNQIPGISGSPYFCLSDLAKHWPSTEKIRRVVFMVTDGEDPYYEQYSMQNPYVDAAISDAQKAGILVYSIYFRNQGYTTSRRTLYGQSYLLNVANETGGQTYANLITSPVSFDPFLEQFKTSLENQYMIGIAAEGSGLQRVKVKSNVRGLKLSAPSAVYVGPEK